MHSSGILVGSVTLHIVSLFCACVSNTITRYCTVDFCISRGLRYAHRDVWGKPILTGKQVGLCVSTCNYWLLLATLMVDIESLEHTCLCVEH